VSTTVCPNGHVSADPEWCDTCGARLGAPAAAAPPASNLPPPTSAPSAAPAGAEPVTCPHCGASNTPDALFCEECGYDFTTGQAPEPPPVAWAPTPAATVGGPVPSGWIVVVEVDPKWYELKGELADQPCPQPSSSTVPLALPTVHIGRSSQSRGIHPEIAIDADTAVSRQHAQLVAVDGAYTAVDLGSTNGTFVVKAGSEPDADITPIDPGVPVALADGDRIYLGAWSRLTVRDTGARPA
jgi:hypothetical protein